MNSKIRKTRVYLLCSDFFFFFCLSYSSISLLCCKPIVPRFAKVRLIESQQHTRLYTGSLIETRSSRDAAAGLDIHTRPLALAHTVASNTHAKLPDLARVLSIHLLRKPTPRNCCPVLRHSNCKYQNVCMLLSPHRCPGVVFEEEGGGGWWLTRVADSPGGFASTNTTTTTTMMQGVLS